VSNPATRKNLAARTGGVLWYKSKCTILFEIMVQIKTKEGHGVENLPPRSFGCGFISKNTSPIHVIDITDLYD